MCRPTEGGQICASTEELVYTLLRRDGANLETMTIVVMNKISRCQTMHLSDYGRASMTLIVVVAALLCVFIIVAVATVRRRANGDLEANSIEPDELHALLKKGEVAISSFCKSLARTARIMIPFFRWLKQIV